MSARLVQAEPPAQQEPDTTEFGCSVCGLRLWNPVGRMKRGWLGLYDDARFPGRCILMLDVHREDLSELEPDLLQDLMWDAQLAAKVIREVSGADRVNFAVLGNAEPHIHVHLIPRFFSKEAFPRQSAWNDPRPQSQLNSEERLRIVQALKAGLNQRR